VRLHALVEDIDVARTAIAGGATVVQLRVKHLPTAGLVERGEGFRELCSEAGVTFVVNDDFEAALRLGADGVHLGRTDPGADRAIEEGLLLGLSASSLDEAVAAEDRGAAYLGAGPVWGTPSKTDADPPIGLDGLSEICRAVSIPVVAIGGVNATNAEDCVRAGAAGVAVIRAATDAQAVREAVDRASR
jgi:thiamine-phosphate pyrophosphorylase